MGLVVIYPKDFLFQIGLAIGFGVRFGLTNNQLDLSYNFIQRDNIYKVGVEKIQAFNVGISIGDLWFVKRREI